LRLVFLDIILYRFVGEDLIELFFRRGLNGGFRGSVIRYFLQYFVHFRLGEIAFVAGVGNIVLAFVVLLFLLAASLKQSLENLKSYLFVAVRLVGANGFVERAETFLDAKIPSKDLSRESTSSSIRRLTRLSFAYLIARVR